MTRIMKEGQLAWRAADSRSPERRWPFSYIETQVDLTEREVVVWLGSLSIGWCVYTKGDCASWYASFT